MKNLKAMCLAGFISLLIGCATPFPVGFLVTDMTIPYPVSGESSSMTKVGTAECISVFALVAVGDASIRTAMYNGGITKVSHVDWEVKNILGVYGRYIVTVYGE